MFRRLVFKNIIKHTTQSTQTTLQEHTTQSNMEHSKPDNIGTRKNRKLDNKRVKDDNDNKDDNDGLESERQWKLSWRP